MKYQEREQLSAFRRRIEIDNIPPGGEQELIRSYAIPLERSVLQQIRQQKRKLLPELGSLREAMVKTEGFAPSPARLTAQFLLEQIVDLAERNSYEAMTRQDLLRMVFWYDMKDGMVCIFNSLNIAERELREGSDQAIADVVSKLADSSDDGAEIYINQQPIWQRFSKDLAGFLVGEPRGFNLVDKSLEILKREAQRPKSIQPREMHFVYPFHISAFIVAGGEFAAKVYKAVQPISAKLPPLSP